MKRRESRDENSRVNKEQKRHDVRISLINGRLEQPPNVTIKEYQLISVEGHDRLLAVVIWENAHGNWYADLYKVNQFNTIDPKNRILADMERPESAEIAEGVYRTLIAQLRSGKLVCQKDDKDEFYIERKKN